MRTGQCLTKVLIYSFHSILRFFSQVLGQLCMIIRNEFGIEVFLIYKTNNCTLNTFWSSIYTPKTYNETYILGKILY